MKKTQLFTLLLLFITVVNHAQSGLTNLSFENWGTSPMGATPVGWFASGATKESTGAQQGTNYVRISNTNMNQGVLMLGSMATFTSTFKGGAPYTQMPVAITGFFKTSGMIPTDVVGLTGLTSKSGSVNAVASFTQGSNVATWTSFSAPFLIFNPGPVDTIFIMASSSNMSGGSNNSISATLDLDNLSLGTTVTGIDKRSLGTAFMVYPNPASGELNIISKDERAVSVLITDLSGRTMQEINLEPEKTKIDLQNYAGGIYFYSIFDKDKALLLTNKFVVKN